MQEERVDRSVEGGGKSPPSIVGRGTGQGKGENELPGTVNKGGGGGVPCRRPKEKNTLPVGKKTDYEVPSAGKEGTSAGYQW